MTVDGPSESGTGERRVAACSKFERWNTLEQASDRGVLGPIIGWVETDRGVFEPSNMLAQRDGSAEV